MDTAGCRGRIQESHIRELGFLSLFLEGHIGRHCIRKQASLVPLLME